jgi:hypothetical protein
MPKRPRQQAKQPEWNNKSTKIDTIAGREPDNNLQTDNLFHFGY